MLMDFGFSLNLIRFAKGIRAAPTDALLADLSPTGQQGSVYGLYHSASTLGSMAGGLMAMIIMQMTLNSYRAVFSFSAIPAICAIAMHVFFVKEPTQEKLFNRLNLIQAREAACC